MGKRFKYGQLKGVLYAKKPRRLGAEACMRFYCTLSLLVFFIVASGIAIWHGGRVRTGIRFFGQADVDQNDVFADFDNLP